MYNREKVIKLTNEEVEKLLTIIAASNYAANIVTNKEKIEFLYFKQNVRAYDPEDAEGDDIYLFIPSLIIGNSNLPFRISEADDSKYFNDIEIVYNNKGKPQFDISDKMVEEAKIFYDCALKGKDNE